MLVLYAAVMPVVLLFCGLSLDVGILELTKLRMQTAADAGALAAQLEAERGTGNWQTMAMEDASINGFTNGVDNVTITVSQQPNFGDYEGRYDALQVTITQRLSTVFMWTLNGGMVTVSAASVVLMTPCGYFYGGGTGGATSYGVDVYTGSLLGNTCPLYASNGIEIESAGQMAMNAEDITGSSGQSSLPGFAFPTPVFNTVSIPDPLAWETEPSFSGTCNRTGYSLSHTTITLSPGNYCKGLNLSNSNVTLSPGLYVITGGATWTSSTVSGTGVTLFFTNGGGATSYGQFIVQNASSVSLSAPTDSTNGGVPGVLVFADRNWVRTGNQDFQLSQSYYYGDGIWYIRGAGMYVNACGTVTAPNYFGIVADNLYTTATIIHLLNNYSNLQAGNPFLQAGLPIGGLVQ